MSDENLVAEQEVDEKVEIIKAMHEHTQQFDLIPEAEWRERVCKGLSNEEYLNELIFKLHCLKTLVYTNIRISREHLEKQVYQDGGES